MEQESESASALKYVVDKVSFVNKLPTLHKATSDDARPTPGYLYQEICNISFESGSYCTDLLTYLVTCLENKSYHVKLKVLRILRFVVDNGHKEFKQALRRKAQGIREATKFGGPPDPLHGNAPYIMVRKEAKDLCAILYDIKEDLREEGHTSSVRMTSSALGGMGTGNKNTLQGFGNVPTKEKSLTESIVGSILDLAGKVVEPASSAHRLPTQDKHFSSYTPVQFGARQESSAPRTDSPDVTATKIKVPSVQIEQKAFLKSRHKKVHRPGRVGGGWEDSDDEDAGAADAADAAVPEVSLDASRDQPVTLAEGLSSGSLFRRSSSPQDSVPRQEDWAAEIQLVKETTEREDLLLKRMDIESFMKSCSTLNCSKIVESTASSMGSSSNTVQLHCLQLVEALLRTDVVSSDEVASVCYSGLSTCFNSPDQQTNIKAKKIILILEKLCSEGSAISNILPAPGRGSARNISPASVSSTLAGHGSANTAKMPSTDQETDMNVSNFSFIKAPFAGAPNSSNSVLFPAEGMLLNADESH